MLFPSSKRPDMCPDNIITPTRTQDTMWSQGKFKMSENVFFFHVQVNFLIFARTCEQYLKRGEIYCSINIIIIIFILQDPNF